MADTSHQLLQALISLTGRSVFPVDDLHDLVGDGKQRKAFNLCDGTRGQTEIAKALNIDQGSFSRTVSRWVDEGVVFRVGEGRDTRLLHVYPLGERSAKKRK